MKILITNDDGWGSPGIRTLEKVAAEFGEVWTVAPANPMSGISHQMTFEQPMKFEEKSERSYVLGGTPADCARVGLTRLGVEFDWILSGINKGGNLGADLNVSGTVAAVREASLFKARGIALSQHLRKFNAEFDWSKPGDLAKILLPKLFAREIGNRNWFNVNLPDIGDRDIESVEFIDTKLDENPLPATYNVLETGDLFYSGLYKDRLRTTGLDVDVCFSGNVSITSH